MAYIIFLLDSAVVYIFLELNILKKKSLLPWRIAYLNAPSNKKNFLYLNLLLTFLSVGQEMFISQLLSLGQPPTGVSNGK